MCLCLLINVPYIKLFFDVVHLGSFNGGYGFCGQPSSVEIEMTLTALKL